MAIIVVGGSNKGVGKTALVCGLIAALPEYRWAAVKISSHMHAQGVSRGLGEHGLGDSAEAASSAPAQPGRAASFRQVLARRMNEMGNIGDPVAVPATDAVPAPSPAAGLIWEESVASEETDTGRYLAAGAARALLVSAVDGDLSDALNQLWPRFGRGSNLIFESNSVAHHVSADACLLIHAVAARTLPLPARKPSFLAALRHADALVAHTAMDKVIPDGLCLAGPDQGLGQGLGQGQQQKSPRPIFHLQTLEQISPQMLEWLRLRLPSPQHF